MTSFTFFKMLNLYSVIKNGNLNSHHITQEKYDKMYFFPIHKILCSSFVSLDVGVNEMFILISTILKSTYGFN